VIRVGLAGCGRIVRVAHAPAYRAIADLATVVAVADPVRASRDRVGDLLDVSCDRRHGKVEQLLAAGGIDALVIAAPNAAHRAIVDAAVAAGVPVLVEKPLGRTVEEANAIVAGAADAGVGLAVSHNRLFDPRFALAAGVVRCGDIGTVHTIRLESLASGYWPGTEDYDPTWRTRTTAAGGGALLDNGYHLVYLAERFAASPIASVFARIERRTGLQVDDVALLLCRHADGTTSSLQVGWASAGGGQPAHEVYGSRGTVAVGRDGHAVSIHRGTEWEHRDVLPDDEWGFEGLFRATLPALADGRPPPTGPEDAVRVQEVVAAAYRSGASGRDERVDTGGVPRPVSGCWLDEWDVRHLLLSVEDRARPRRDRAALLGVMRRSAAELATVAHGRLDIPADCVAPGVVLEGVPLWLFESNAWILAPGGRGGACIVVDVPPDPSALLDRLVRHRLDVAAVFLTHGHVDHAGGLAELLAARGESFPVFVHPADLESVLRPSSAGGLVGRLGPLRPPDPGRIVDLVDGRHMAIAGVDVVPLHTPGHTPGSTCVLVTGTGRPLLFTGDHLFAEGVGRTDLAGASEQRLRMSMAQSIDPLDGVTVILPGHGDVTDLAHARDVNPFLAVAR
jgi:hydroxyacylglutathione hydrolase